MSAKAAPSDTTSLLVPIHLEAWVREPSNQQLFTWYQADYGNLASYQSPLPVPFGPSSVQDLPYGVFLHWALPDALTHGKEQPDGEVAFPYVPNRWLVARFQTNKDVTGQYQRRCKLWVVRSDYLDPDGAGGSGSSSYLDPNAPTTPDGVREATIGKSYPIEAWETAKAGGGSAFLRAVGPGNVTFAAYMPFVRDVFSFVDSDLTMDTDKRIDDTYAYMVVGWYSCAPEADPLRAVTTFAPEIWARGQPEAKQQEVSAGQTEAERFETLLAELSWSVASDLPATPPSTSLYHSLLHSVQWQSGAGARTPDKSKVTVAVGNTATDALAALVQHEVGGNQGARLAELFEAAQYDLLPTLDQPGGQAALAERIRAGWFGSDPGGILWEVVAAVSDDAVVTDLLPGTPSPPSPPAPTPDQTRAIEEALARLNADQRSLDELQRSLESCQSDLYMLWWKCRIGDSARWAPYDPGYLLPAAVTPQWGELKEYMKGTLYPDLREQVQQLASEVAALRETLPDPTPTDPTDPRAPGPWVQEKWPDIPLATLGLSLEATPMPPFGHANDPVVVVKGLNSMMGTERSRKHGEDGTLLCRLPLETVAGKPVDKTGAVRGIKVGEKTFTAADFADDIGPGDDYATAAQNGLVPSCPSLFVEAFFLDPASAPLIAARKDLAEGAVAAAIAGGASSWKGQAPVEFAITRWQQAWSPLFMEWHVAWFPTGAGKGPNRKFDPGDWTFDGEDFRWMGTGVDLGISTAYTGRTFLTPQAQLVLADKIKTYLKDHPGVEPSDLEGLVETVSGWDLLAQSLSGLTERLLTLEAQETFPPPLGLAALVGDQYRTVPDLRGLEVPPPLHPLDTASYESSRRQFHPIRAGLLKLESLTFIDTFGQKVDVVTPNTAQGFEPVWGRGLKPEAATDPQPQLPAPGVVQLPPRVVQSSRLDLRLLSANRRGDVATSGEPNAICGWLLPNHLDGGIEVYDDTGSLLGELIGEPTGSARWRPRPGPPGEIEIANPALRAVVGSLAGQTGAVFEGVLGIIDETLWTVDPLGGRKDQALSALIGRPLAVVRAELALTLRGRPAKSQKWHRMAQGSAVDGSGSARPPWRPSSFIGEIEEIDFPVRLGSLERRDDGLIGYFLDDSYEVFHTVHRPDECDSFIEPIGPDNFINLRYRGDVRTVTLLLDPRGSVHASTGLLPTTEVALPAHVVERFLRLLQVTFRTGPLITPPGELRVRKPAEKRATWTWLQQVGADWQEGPVVDADDRARLPDGLLQLREGWLKMKLEPPE